jgi:DNA invertase Pin-like site-specific DNA recombinase
VLTRQTEVAHRICAAHRAKIAYIYVRQSTIGQVRQHQESTEMQYRLAERAADLGWPRERIEIIDDDLGKSGASSVGRHGFQHLIAEIGLGKAGLVLSLDASRLARNNRDWHQLLELCSLFGVIIGDGERLYDAGDYHDRLLLGLTGIMSEAELHQIRVRLLQGGRQKAMRGELRLPLPAGLAYDAAGKVILNPDGEVQARLHMVFARFRVLQSASAVARELLQHRLMLPVRPVNGPAPHTVIWVPAADFRVRQILHQPCYAGAYVWGRWQQDPTRRRAGSESGARVQVAADQWPVCLRDAHPGYIGWEEFMANQKRLAENACRRSATSPGVPRQGGALLQGIAYCGRCGRRMALRYSGQQGEYPVYHCEEDWMRRRESHCQSLRATQIDDEVERVLLASLEPDQIAIAAAAVGQMEAELATLERQWALKLERARYEAERARRQYDAVEPENRLVARSLEHAWEMALRHCKEVEQAHEHWRREQPAPVSDADRAEVLRLAADLPRAWQAATVAERKQILRAVISKVVLHRQQEEVRVLIRIVWQTGANSEHTVRACVPSYRRYVGTEPLKQRVQELITQDKTDEEIAAALNAEHALSARGKPFKAANLFRLRRLWCIPTAKINGKDANPARWSDGSYSVRGAAEVLGFTMERVFRWLHDGRLKGRQRAKSQPWQIDLSPDQIVQLKAQADHLSQSRMEAP